MRILVVSPRFPEPGAKGDQLRVFAFLRRLAARHELTVLTAAAPPGPEALARLEALARVHCVPASRPGRARAALGALARGRPGQAGWSLPPAAARAARELAPGHDVALAVTVRAATPLPIPLVVDHIDALSLNMRQRARGPEPLPVRAAAAVESRLLARWEARVAPHAAAHIVISHADAAALPGDVVVLPHPFEGEVASDAAPAGRDVDVIFTGNMAYPPNTEAAEFLAREIAPRLRQRRPGVRVLVVGRNASRLRLGGVEVESDVPDLADYLRRSRVAIVPLLSGTGQANKVFEAAAAGAAVVATSWVGERFEFPVLTADGADDLAAAAARLLEDEERRRTQAEAGLAAMRSSSPEQVVERLEAVLAGAAEASRGGRVGAGNGHVDTPDVAAQGRSS